MEQEIQILKALASGFDPFTGEVIPKDNILQNVDIVRALYIIIGHLENPKNSHITKRDNSFVYIPELQEKITIINGEISLTQIVKNIQEAYPDNNKIKFNSIVDLLLNKGVLMETFQKNGKTKRVSTELGETFGIYNRKIMLKTGFEVEGLKYNKDGQKYVISCLSEIVNK